MSGTTGSSPRGAADQQDPAPRRVHPRVVVAGVPATAFGALQRRLGHAFTDQEHVAHVQRQVQPGLYRRSPSTWMCLNRSRACRAATTPRIFVCLADDADQVVHRLLQFQLQRVRVLRGGTVRRRLEGCSARLAARRRRLRHSSAGCLRPHVVGSAQAGPTAEHQQVRQRVAASRFEPCMPPEHSPAAKSPGTVAAPVSASTSTPPIT